MALTLVWCFDKDSLLYVAVFVAQTMMEPVPYTRTEGAHEDCVCYTVPWWEHPASLLPKNKTPSLTNKNTVMDSDYQYRGLGQRGNTRFSAHRDRSPAVGTGVSINC